MVEALCSLFSLLSKRKFCLICNCEGKRIRPNQIGDGTYKGKGKYKSSYALLCLKQIMLQKKSKLNILLMTEARLRKCSST